MNRPTKYSFSRGFGELLAAKIWEQSGVKTICCPIQLAQYSEQCITLLYDEEFRFKKVIKLLINGPLLGVQACFSVKFGLKAK